jgi:hypothetical protein
MLEHKHYVGASSGAAFRSHASSSSASSISSNVYSVCAPGWGLGNLDELILLIFRVSKESLDSASQAYGFMLLYLKNRVTNPGLTLVQRCCVIRYVGTTCSVMCYTETTTTNTKPKSMVRYLDGLLHVPL